MIVLFTDFGTADPYVGQMHAALRAKTDKPVIDLLHHVPSFDARAGAYLLDALQRQLAAGCVLVCVVDPGVGGPRAPVMLQADGKWYVGPDNGLLNIVARRAVSPEVYRIDWRPESLSTSFHGRDLFAPVAASLAAGERPASTPWTLHDTAEWPEELAEILYIDHYGNAMTGIRANALDESAVLRVRGRPLPARETFTAGAPGEPFWYRNSVGLVEIAVREDSAAALLDLTVGEPVSAADNERILGSGPDRS